MVKLDTLKGHNVKVGDIVRFRGDTDGSHDRMGSPTVIGEIKDGTYYATGSGAGLVERPLWEVLSRVDDLVSINFGQINTWPIPSAPKIPKDVLDQIGKSLTKPSGGPSKYYDFPFRDWVTVNDMIEYLSEKQWGKHSWIFKDIVKACTRWGSKDGTTYVYDAKKIIYYGARLLMSVADKATLRAYLQELLDDKQFKENNND